MKIRSLAVLALLPLCASAQLITGSLTGRVVDPSGLGVASAPLELAHVSTGRTRSSQTDAAGDFVLSGLVS